MDKITKELVDEIEGLITKFIDDKKKDIIIDVRKIMTTTLSEMKVKINTAKDEIQEMIEESKGISKDVLNNIKNREKSMIGTIDYIKGSAKIINDIENMTIKNIKFMKKFYK